MIFRILFFIFFFVNILAYSDNLSLNYLNRILNYEDKDVIKNIERLSGGRILLTDDPANYVIYERLEAYILGFEKEISNIEDMISYYKTEESILGNISEIILRIKELSEKRADGILSDFDRGIIESEINQLYEEIIDILKESDFNKINPFYNLFDEQIIKNIFQQKDIYNQTNIDELSNFIIKQRVVIGTLMNTIEYSIKGETTVKENTSEMQTHGDIEFIGGIFDLKRNQILLIVNILMIKQVKN